MNLRGKAAEALAGLRHDPLEALRLVRAGLATAKFRYVRRCAGAGSVFGMGNRIINAANVSIGRGCLFQDSIYLRAGAHGRIRIGDRVALNSFCQLYGHGGITLGDETQLGPGTLITTTGHDYEDDDLAERFTPVTIGRRVWVGANVTIIGGVTIGDGAVIGAGAVVIRDVPAHTLAVGVPARVVRRLRAGGGDDAAGASQEHGGSAGTDGGRIASAGQAAAAPDTRNA